jgi:hypothetical protein
MAEYPKHDPVTGQMVYHAPIGVRRTSKGWLGTFLFWAIMVYGIMAVMRGSP